MKNRLAIIGLILTMLAILVPVINRKGDKQEKHNESQPKLEYVPGSAKFEGGCTVLTLENKSPIATAAITRIHFRVDDPDALARIQQKHPKPRSGKVSMNIVDDVVFTEGDWWNDRYYGFSRKTSNHIPPSAVNDLQLAIVNRKWAGESFVGTLVIRYTGENSPFQLHNVMIQARGR